MSAIVDSLKIRRAANDWIIEPGCGASEFTHVAETAKQLAAHVEARATAQVAGPTRQ